MLTVVEARNQKIIAALEQPLTMQQLRTLIGCNIHTLRKSMAHLIENGVVQPTGMVINREPTYVVTAKRPVPELYNKQTNKYVSPLDMLRVYASNPLGNTGGMLAARQIFDAVADLLQLSSVEDKQVVAAEIERIRAACKSAIMQLNVSADMLSQLLANPTWWSPDNLKTIQTDPDYDANEIFEAWSRVQTAKGGNDGP